MAKNGGARGAPSLVERAHALASLAWRLDFSDAAQEAELWEAWDEVREALSAPERVCVLALAQEWLATQAIKELPQAGETALRRWSERSEALSGSAHGLGLGFLMEAGREAFAKPMEPGASEQKWREQALIEMSRVANFPGFAPQYEWAKGRSAPTALLLDVAHDAMLSALREGRDPEWVAGMEKARISGEWDIAKGRGSAIQSLAQESWGEDPTRWRELFALGAKSEMGQKISAAIGEAQRGFTIGGALELAGRGEWGLALSAIRCAPEKEMEKWMGKQKLAFLAGERAYASGVEEAVGLIARGPRFLESSESARWSSARALVASQLAAQRGLGAKPAPGSLAALPDSGAQSLSASLAWLHDPMALLEGLPQSAPGGKESGNLARPSDYARRFHAWCEIGAQKSLGIKGAAELFAPCAAAMEAYELSSSMAPKGSKEKSAAMAAPRARGGL